MQADGLGQVGQRLAVKLLARLVLIGTHLFNRQGGDALKLRLVGGIAQQGAQAPSQAGTEIAFCHACFNPPFPAGRPASCVMFQKFFR